MKRVFALACGLLVCSLGLRAAVAQTAPMKWTYDDHVRPILREKCFSCHNPDKKSGGLDMTSYTSLMLGGSSGEVIERGNVENSYLYSLVSHDTEPYMPPMVDRIPDGALEAIKAWIEGGALENNGSRPAVSNKATSSLALTDVPTSRPEVIPVPGHLDLEPLIVTPVPGTVTAMATSPWAPVVAIAGQKQVLLHNTQSLEFIGALPFPEGVPYVLRFSRNGALLLAGGGRGGASGSVVVWNITTGERVFEVGDELDAVLAADISADQTRIAVGGPSKVVRVYGTADGRLLYECRKHTDWILALEFSPDGVLLTTGDRGGNLFVWESATGREYLTLKGHTAAITGVSWRADSNIVASASEDATIRLWEMENGNPVKNWAAHGGGAASIEFARDGRLVSTGRDRTTKVWDSDGNPQRAFDALSDIGVSASFCDESNRVVAGDWTGAIRVWDAVTGGLAGTVTSNPPTLAARLEVAKQALAARQTDQVVLAEAARQAALERDAQLLAAKAQIEAIEKANHAAEEKAKVAEAASTAGQQQVAQTTAEVTRWQAEIEFVAKMKSLDEQWDAAKATFQARTLDVAPRAETAQTASTHLQQSQAVLDPLRAELSESRKRLDAAQGVLAAAVEQQSQSKARLMESLRGMAMLVEATTAVQQASVKAKEAVEKTADPELKAASEVLAALVAKKDGELAGAKTAVEQAETAVKEADAKVVEGQATTAAYAAETMALATKVAELETRHEELAKVAQMAQQALAEAQRAALESEQRIASLTAEIIAARTGPHGSAKSP